MTINRLGEPRPASEFLPLSVPDLAANPGDTYIHGVVDPDGNPVDAWGFKLYDNGHLGGDMLHVPPNCRFPTHVHPGHHLLYCVAGAGTFSLDGKTYPVAPGDLYMVEGDVPHAVGAGPEGHTLVAFGAPHRQLDDPDRMLTVDWEGVAVEVPAEPPSDRVVDLADRARLHDTSSQGELVETMRLRHDLTVPEAAWLQAQLARERTG